MGNTPPTLDYAVPEPLSRLRKWTRRILLAVLVLACLYATPIAWLYWGWRQEQPARAWIEEPLRFPDSTGLEIQWAQTEVERIGPAILDRLLPDRLHCLRERVEGVTFCFGLANDTELPQLEQFRHLTHLSLAVTVADNATLATLKGLKRLECVDLEDTEVTDAGLMHLKGLTGLRKLKLKGTYVTDAGVADLQKALPQCEITH